jgi:hypothetical protein
MYKDFNQIFDRVLQRLNNWVLYEDTDIHMAGQCLKLIANSGQQQNLVSDMNLQKLFSLYEQDDLPTDGLVAIGETFITISKCI